MHTMVKKITSMFIVKVAVAKVASFKCTLFNIVHLHIQLDLSIV